MGVAGEKMAPHYLKILQTLMNPFQILGHVFSRSLGG